MERHKCKLCSRRFGSGRALGGHMRSHFAILPVPPKTHLNQLNETSSSQQFRPSRSTRVKKSSMTELKKRSVSSMSETCSDEDVAMAMSLMLLSRDKWVRREMPDEKMGKIFVVNGTGDDAKIHECPVCCQVFKSGQALGGHKRSHLLSSAAASSHSSVADAVWFIDLNLPAPLEDEQEQINQSQITVS